MHDIASVLLLVLSDERKAYFVLERLCLFHIRDACAKDLGEIKSVLFLLFPLLRLVDVQVYDFILRSHRDADLTIHPVFALPWILTLYSHTLDQLATIARLMDFFIVSHPLMPLYFAAQVVPFFRLIMVLITSIVQLICYLKEDLLKLPCDLVEVMNFLKK
jgi:hypothetical protein